MHNHKGQTKVSDLDVATASDRLFNIEIDFDCFEYVYRDSEGVADPKHVRHLRPLYTKMPSERQDDNCIEPLTGNTEHITLSEILILHIKVLRDPNDVSNDDSEVNLT